jgi:hypothetical protein
MKSWEWYTDVPVKVLFFHCLLSARHNPKRWRGIDLSQGQFPTGVSLLSEETGLTVSQVRTALKKLAMTNELTVQSTSQGTVITVNNYSTYHDDGEEEPQTDRKRIANGSQTDRKPIANQSQLYIRDIKDIKDIKNIKKKGVKKKKGEEKDLIFPDCVDEDLVKKYIQHRKDIKKIMSHHAKELFLLKVAKFHDKGQDVKTLIERAIIAGWSDIYEDKGNGNGKDYPGSKRIPVKKAGTKSEGKREFIPGLETTITVIDKKGNDQRGQENSIEVVKH